MTKELAEFSIAYLQKKGADYVEARAEQTDQNTFILKNGNLEVGGFESFSGIGIRFLIKNTLGFVSTNDMTKAKLKSLLNSALKTTIKAGPITENVELAQEKVHKKRYKVQQKIALPDVDTKEKIAMLFDTEKALQNTGATLPGRFISLSDSLTTEYLVTSEGTRIEATVPKEGYYYILTLREGTRRSQHFWSYGASGGWEQALKWDMENTLSNEAKLLQKNLKYGIKPPKQNIDLICAPQVAGIMVHESGGHPYEADRIFGREAAQAGESFIDESMIGYQIGSEVVNIVDDPTIPGSYGFYLYDNEGVKARRKNLVVNGKINEFLHNRETAAKMGLPSNGSSRATDYDKESIVRMSNTFILPGRMSEDELIGGVKKGIYMKSFTECNIDAKRIHQKYVGAESYLIENGKITKPVLSPALEISSFELWKKIDAVAKNFELHAGSCGKGEPMQAVPVFFGGPSIRIRGVRLR